MSSDTTDSTGLASSPQIEHFIAKAQRAKDDSFAWYKVALDSEWRLEQERNAHGATLHTLQAEQTKSTQLENIMHQLFEVARQSADLTDGLRVQLDLVQSGRTLELSSWSAPPTTFEILMELQYLQSKSDLFEEVLDLRSSKEESSLRCGLRGIHERVTAGLKLNGDRHYEGQACATATPTAGAPDADVEDNAEQGS